LAETTLLRISSQRAANENSPPRPISGFATSYVTVPKSNVVRCCNTNVVEKRSWVTESNRRYINRGGFVVDCPLLQLIIRRGRVVVGTVVSSCAVVDPKVAKLFVRARSTRAYTIFSRRFFCASCPFYCSVRTWTAIYFFLIIPRRTIERARSSETNVRPSFAKR